MSIDNRYPTDVTQSQVLKRSTQEIKRRALELELIAEVSTAATRLLDADELLQTVVDLAKEKFNLYHAHIYVLDESGRNLVLAAGAGEVGRTMVSEGHQIALDRQQSLVARAARTREGVTINDVREEPGFLPNQHLPHTRAEMALPMVVGDELLGVLDFQASDSGRFDTEDIRVKTILAQQVAIALRNVRTFAQQQRQLQLQEASGQISELLRYGTTSTEDMLDAVMQVIVSTLGADNAVVSHYDAKANTWHGVTGVGAFMTRDVAKSFVDPGERYPHAMEAVRTRQVVFVPRAELYPNFPPEFLDEKIGIKSVIVLPLTVGEIVENVLFVNFNSAHRIFTQDEINLTKQLAAQISVGLERRTQEELARKNEEQFRALASNVPGIIYHCKNDADYTMLYMSEHVQSVLGYAASDFLENGTRTYASLIHPEDEPFVTRSVVDAVTERRPFNIEYRVYDVNGNIHWMYETGQATDYDEHGHAHFLDGAIFDITDRKAAEEIARVEHDRATSIARNLEVVSEVASAVTSVLDIDLLLQTVVELTRERFELYHAHVYLVDESGKNLVLTAGAGDPGRIMKERGHHIPLDHMTSIVARAAREGQPVAINDVSQSATFLPNPLLPLTRAEHAAPMIIDGKVIGVLDVQADKVGVFDEVTSKTQVILAGEIAVAVVNAQAFQLMLQSQKELSSSLEERERLTEQARRRASELETVAIVSNAISMMLDQDDLLQTVVELTKANFDFYHAHIYLLDESKENLVLAAGAGEPGEKMKAAGHRIPAAHPHSLVARAARTAAGVVSNDVSQQEDFLPNPLLPETRSEMALPMVVGEEVVGVLDLQANTRNRFTDDDVLVQTTLASQIAVAIQNVRAIERIRLTERAIENSSSGMSIADARRPNMPLVYVNHAFETMTGYTAAEVIGKNCRFLQGDDRDQEGIHEVRAAIREGRTAIVVLRNYRKDGTLFWNELRLSPIFNTRGELTHFVGTQTDITERREIEIEREQMLQRTAEQAQKDRETAERLRELDRLKSQFLANISHELRTPLNSIIGYSELLLDGDDGELSEEALEDIDTIHSSGQHLLSIINEILDLAKIEAGQMSLARSAVDFKEVAQEVMQTAQVLVKDKPVTLDLVEVSQVSPLDADTLRLRQIMTNLVSNAVKFTEAGSITIAYGQDSPQMAYIEVRDTGIGISQEDQEVIFQQFRQVDGSSTRRAGGTGLGLTITRALVELHGGTISVTSEIGKGTTFRITLPMHVSTAVTVA